MTPQVASRPVSGCYPQCPLVSGRVAVSVLRRLVGSSLSLLGRLRSPCNWDFCSSDTKSKLQTNDSTAMGIWACMVGSVSSSVGAKPHQLHVLFGESLQGLLPYWRSSMSCKSAAYWLLTLSSRPCSCVLRMDMFLRSVTCALSFAAMAFAVGGGSGAFILLSISWTG